jgi:hypothetical protein
MPKNAPSPESSKNVIEEMTAASPVEVLSVVSIGLQLIEEIIDICKHVRSQGGDPGKAAESILNRLVK